MGDGGGKGVGVIIGEEGKSDRMDGGGFAKEIDGHGEDVQQRPVAEGRGHLLSAQAVDL